MPQLLDKYQKIAVKEVHNEVYKLPDVSICIQTYKHVEYIRECLDSILNQRTAYSYEILIGEDNSTDGTREICIEYANKYTDKIRLFLHHRENNILINGKPTGRFNSVYNVLQSRGKYIARCEGDDYWTDLYKLQKQVDFLETNPKYSMCCTNFSEVNEEGKLLKEFGWSEKYRNPIITHLDIIEYYHPKTLTVVFRKDALPEQLPKEYFSTPNGDTFLFALLSRKGPAAYLNFISGHYRVNQGGIWSMKSPKHRLEMAERSLLKMKEFFSFSEEQKAVNAKLSRIKIFEAKLHFQSWKLLSAGIKIYKSLKQTFKLNEKQINGILILYKLRN